MTQPIRVAVLGFGLAGRVFHCPFVAAVPGLELSVIVQRKGDEAARAYPDARILRSAEEAFADPAIDLIVVGTPNATHMELATAALEAGKHVVVDKPVAPTAADTLKLLEVARSRDLILAPFHNRRWDGDLLTIKKLLADNTLGRIVRFLSRFDRYRPTQRPGTWKEAAGDEHGLLMDLGPHLIDQALHLFGTPDRVTGSVRMDRDKTDIVDGWDITLEFDRKGHTLRAELGSSMVCADYAPRFAVHGNNGSYVKFGLDPQEPALVAGTARPPVMGSAERWFAEPETAWGLLTLAPDIDQPATLVRERVQTIDGDYRNYYANVRDAILGAALLAVTPEDAWRVARIMELARQSSAERRTLTPDLTLPV